MKGRTKATVTSSSALKQDRGYISIPSYFENPIRYPFLDAINLKLRRKRKRPLDIRMTEQEASVVVELNPSSYPGVKS